MLPAFIADRLFKIGATAAIFLAAWLAVKGHDHRIKSGVKAEIKQVTINETHNITAAADRSRLVRTSRWPRRG